MAYKIGQSNFIEIIVVTPYAGVTCKPNVVLGKSRWQNPKNRFDINNDGVVTLEDYTALQQWLTDNGEMVLPGNKPDDELYVDVNGNGSAETRDLELLSQYLNDHDAVDRTPEQCFPVIDFRIERDLVSPELYKTVKMVASSKGLSISSFVPFLRNYLNNSIRETTYNASVETKSSIVLVHNDLFVVDEPTVFPLLELSTNSWQNTLNRFDVLGDGIIDSNDLTALSEYLSTYGETELPSVRPAGLPFYDVNGDFIISSDDYDALEGYLATGDGTEVFNRVSTVIRSVNGSSSSCSVSYPILDRIVARIGSSGILPARFVWP